MQPPNNSQVTEADDCHANCSAQSLRQQLGLVLDGFEIVLTVARIPLIL